MPQLRRKQKKQNLSKDEMKHLIGRLAANVLLFELYTRSERGPKAETCPALFESRLSPRRRNGLQASRRVAALASAGNLLRVGIRAKYAKRPGAHTILGQEPPQDLQGVSLFAAATAGD